MKSNKLFFGALTLLAFTACSDDKNTNAPDQVLNDGTESYITVRIMDATSAYGRAGEEYSGGKDVTDDTKLYAENAIESLTIAFYDANMNFITFGTAGKTDITTNTTTGNLETLGTAKVKLTLRPDQSTPKYAIAFANPIQNQPGLSNVEATQKSTRDRYWTSTSAKVNEKDMTKYLFAMNNSVYFSGDKNASNHELQVATPVTEKNFYKGKDDSKAEAVDFYIERIASKVLLKSPAENNEITVDPITTKIDGETGEEKLLVFVPEKWKINAEEKSTYLMKWFTQSYTTLDANLAWGQNVLWNHPENFRSYWAHSINFSTAITNFPDVSDDVVTTTPLTYHTYKDIKDNGATIGSPLYTFENTRQASSFLKNSAVASAVLIGHYEIRDKASSTTPTTATNFYRRNSSIYTAEGFWAAMASSQQLIAKKTGEKTEGEGENQKTVNIYSGLTGTELAAIAEIYHPTSTTLQDKVVENQVSIKLKDNASLDDYYIRVSDGKYQKYTEVQSTWTASTINEYLLQVCGLTEAYTNGMAYFNIPIRHLGVKTGESLGAGYYGVVRNHTYEITVEKIANTAMATGVFKDTEEIVPSTTNDDYNLKANFKVLAWRLIAHTVTLGGNSNE